MNLKTDMKVTNEYFIRKAKAFHGDIYDYSLVDYKGWNVNVKIICSEHGVFEQIPNNHYRSAGCPFCGFIKSGQSLTKLIKNRKSIPLSAIAPDGARLIPLSKGKFAIVDEDDYERASKWNWNMLNHYAQNINTYMHRFIMNVTDPKILVDHINHNKLDNRKSNLRICDHQQNQWNRVKRAGTTSIYKGVSWDASRNKWSSAIRVNETHKHLGRFDCEIEAAKAYDRAAIKHQGEFACLNIAMNEEKEGITVDHFYKK